jgi:hypothetical protein
MRAFALCLMMLPLGACVAETPDPMQIGCGAEELQGLVGQPASVLETMRFSQPLRVIEPGMAVTMDFNPERLNIHVDGAKKISRVICG